MSGEYGAKLPLHSTLILPPHLITSHHISSHHNRARRVTFSHINHSSCHTVQWPAPALCRLLPSSSMTVTRRSQRASLSQETETNAASEERKEEEAVDGEVEEVKRYSERAGPDTTSSGSSSSSRRYVLRGSISGGTERLSRVDSVLHRLKRQRERREGREWMDGEERAEAKEHEEGTDANVGRELPEPPESEAADGAEEGEYEGVDYESAAVSPPVRKRVRSHHTRNSAADEYDDGSGFVVYSDEETHEADEDEDEGGGEEEEANETIGHMRLHNQLQTGNSDDEYGDGRGATLSSSTPLAILFTHPTSHSSLVLPLDAAFGYWMAYLAAVLIDQSVSASLLSTSTTRRLLLRAVQCVEEQFLSRLEKWVKSSTWERGRERFHIAITRLPYITSRRLNAYDAFNDSSEAQSDTESVDGGSGGRTCDTCRGQHTATHLVEVMGVPYDFQHLTHPFDTERIFGCQQRTRSSPVRSVRRRGTLHCIAHPLCRATVASGALLRRTAVHSRSVSRGRAVPSPHSPLPRHATFQVTPTQSPHAAATVYDWPLTQVCAACDCAPCVDGRMALSDCALCCSCVLCWTQWELNRAICSTTTPLCWLCSLSRTRPTVSRPLPPLALQPS